MFGIMKSALSGINMLFYLIHPIISDDAGGSAKKSLTLLQEYSIDVLITHSLEPKIESSKGETQKRKSYWAAQVRDDLNYVSAGKSLRNVPGSVHGPTVPTRLPRSNGCVAFATSDEATEYHFLPDILDLLPQRLSFDWKAHLVFANEKVDIREMCFCRTVVSREFFWKAAVWGMWSRRIVTLYIKSLSRFKPKVAMQFRDLILWLT
jgi:hypothetical protein